MDTKELMARAAYDAIPNGGYERRDTTDTANVGTLVFVADPWEEAEDRHAECSELAESIRAALSAAGYAIVPREPTEKMIAAGCHYGNRSDMASRWKDMVAASEESK